MSSEKQTNSSQYEYEDLASPEVLPTVLEGVSAVETNFDDPELQELIEKNTLSIRQGEIDIDSISMLRSRKDGFAYKVQLEDESGTQTVGAVYLITKGRDARTAEAAYFVDQSYEGQGIMGASVAAVANRYQSDYELMFDIGNENEASIRIARSLGAKALDATATSQRYYADRKR